MSVDAVELELTGVRGDRRFYLVDDEGALLNAKRVPSLLAVRAELDDGRLLLRFPDGVEVVAEVELGERIVTSFFGRPVRGTWSKARGALRCPTTSGGRSGSPAPSARATASIAGVWRAPRSSPPGRSTR